MALCGAREVKLEPPPLGGSREDEFAEVELRKRTRRGVGSLWSVLKFVAEVLQDDIR
jgi:hypothetical protein